MKGQILISQPFMLDDNFRRTVIIMAEHDDEGSIGFILNRPVELDVNALISAFPNFKARLGYGGPVGQDAIHYVHRLGEELKESMPITDGLWWGGDFEQLISMVELGQVDEKDILFFIGYSGWSVGQLDDEIKEGSWIISEITPAQVLEDDSEELWKEVLKPINNNFRIISEIPDAENYN